MSYILDALKKSEQEHKKGQVPGLGTVQGLPGPSGRYETDRLIRLYGLGTILIVALGIGAWLLLRNPAPAPLEAPPVTTGQLAAEDKTPAPTPPKAAGPTKAGLKPTIAPSTAKANKQSAPHPPVSGTERPKTLKAVTPETTAPSSPVLPAPMIEPAPASARVEETARDHSPAGGNAPGETEAQIKPELLPVVSIEELPPETLSEMPQIKIGLHLFSDTPGSRRASINGRLMREGQQVDKDLVLVEIIRQGVILSFRGRKFTMPVFPR